MKIRKSLLAVISAAVLASPGILWAHHSPLATFNLNNPVTLKGTFTKIEWVNPHVWIYLNVKGADGKSEEWKVEAGSPLRMQKRGLERGFFRPGAEIIVGGFPARDNTAKTLGGWVVSFPERESAGQESSFALGR